MDFPFSPIQIVSEDSHVVLLRTISELHIYVKFIHLVVSLTRMCGYGVFGASHDGASAILNNFTRGYWEDLDYFKTRSFCLLSYRSLRYPLRLNFIYLLFDFTYLKMLVDFQVAYYVVFKSHRSIFILFFLSVFYIEGTYSMQNLRENEWRSPLNRPHCHMCSNPQPYIMNTSAARLAYYVLITQ